MKCVWSRAFSCVDQLRGLAGGIILLAAAGGAGAADAPPRYDLRVWQSDDGLPQNSVTALAQTPEGYLWVGTREGLVRFDGYRFVSCESPELKHLKNVPINALVATREGALWIASEGGGLTQVLHGAVRRFLKSDGLADNQVQCLLEARDGTLWIGSETGLTRWRDGAFTTFTDDRLHNNSIKALCEDRNGIFRIATVTGLVSIDGAGNVSADNFGVGAVPGVLKAVWADREGRLWLGATDGLVCLTDGLRGRYTEALSFPERITTVIKEDSAGQLWVGTYNGLMRRLDGKVSPWWLNKMGVSDVVHVIFEDREQNLWVGGRDGLYRLSPTRFVTFTTEEGLSYNNVTSVCEDREGVMWFGTWGGGVNCWKDGRFSTVTETNGLAHDTVLSLCVARDGALWVGMDFAGGLTRLGPGGRSDFSLTNGLIPAAIRVICEDNGGALWVGTTRGLNRIRGAQIDTLTTTNGLPSNNVTAILASRNGGLWIGTEGGLGKVTDEKSSRIEPVSGVPGRHVNALYEDAATNLWIGTRGAGVICWRDGKARNYTTRLGLFSDEVFEIIEDDAGYLWFSCPRGIFRVSRQQFEAIDAGTVAHLNCTTFGREDGLATVQCNGVAKPAGWKSADGRLWFATTRGVVMVAPRIKLNELAPTVAVEEFVVDQQVLRRACDSLAPPPEPVRVAAGSGRLEIRFTALSLQSAEKNRFKYRLKGFDPDWVEAGHQRIANYHNVTPGVYQFEVLGANNDGVWAAQSASLAFRVEPHFWQTWWFRCVLVALPIVPVILIYRARVAQLRALENLRIRIAADLHDDVGSRLTKVAMVTELADRELVKGDAAKSHVQNIIRTVRDITRAMDEIVWTINPRNDTLENLANYIFHYAQEYFQDTGVRCRLDLPPELPDGRVSTDVRHNLFMAVKEALNNILKHAGASDVRIALTLTEGQLVITINDNGRGYHALSPDPTGDGLRNMRDRLEKMGGRFEIARNAGGGTLITMRLPGKWA